MQLKQLVMILAILAVLVVPAMAQDTVGTEITSITTVSSASEGSSFADIAGDSEFADGTFTVNFLGLSEAITAIEFDSGSATVADAIPAEVAVRYAEAGDPRQVTWYMGNYVPADATFALAAQGPLTAEEHLSGNNILAGVDNTFTNEGATVGETPFTGNQGIERIDFVLESSVEAADEVAFAVFERGPGGHDGFGIAAITGVDDAGTPTAYGPLVQTSAGEWGNTFLAHMPYYVISNLSDGSGGTPTNPTLTGSPQQIGGILFRTSELVDAGTEVFGYSLVATDVTCTAEELVDIAADCYPKDTGNLGGIDFPGMNLGALMLGDM